MHATVSRHFTDAAAACPTLEKKAISPHVIRHTTATHLLCAGVDISTLRAWLGHVSIDTTNVYAEVDLGDQGRCWPPVDHSLPAKLPNAAEGTIRP